MPTELRHLVSIPAPPAAVFPYLVEPSQLVRWMGDRARVEAVDGGAYELDINGVLVRGHIIECRPPKRLVIAWGHRDSVELPPGSSTVEIRLRESDDGGRSSRSSTLGCRQPNSTSTAPGGNTS